MRPLPHSAHKKFVETEGWANKGRARQGKTGAHFGYTLTLATGDVLYTRVSHGSGQIEDPGRVAVILREQLRVTEDEFWDCVDNGTLPGRPAPPGHKPAGTPLDAALLRNLVRKVGLSAEEVERLTKDEAVERWNNWLSSGGPSKMEAKDS